MLGTGFGRRVKFINTNTESVNRGAYKNVNDFLTSLTFMIGFGYCLGLLLYGLSGCDLAVNLIVFIRIFLYRRMERK